MASSFTLGRSAHEARGWVTDATGKVTDGGNRREGEARVCGRGRGGEGPEMFYVSCRAERSLDAAASSCASHATNSPSWILSTRYISVFCVVKTNFMCIMKRLTGYQHVSVIEKGKRASLQFELSLETLSARPPVPPPPPPPPAPAPVAARSARASSRLRCCCCVARHWRCCRCRTQSV